MAVGTRFYRELRRLSATGPLYCSESRPQIRRCVTTQKSAAAASKHRSRPATGSAAQSSSSAKSDAYTSGAVSAPYAVGRDLSSAHAPRPPSPAPSPPPRETEEGEEGFPADAVLKVGAVEGLPDAPPPVAAAAARARRGDFDAGASGRNELDSDHPGPPRELEVEPL
eukprot:CAMPEP_0172604474 /NCGR_PEP_ID=MMETSP1068-20121228/24732_1 /TAXON_ID=35684 /ORGANISM="Pseudopedinella elastica, Strain CCMP716" /LENGTH=167 /DNA_ID=CAMNT_0013406561 /DNA_START=299 /DNA_END=797 /DNA_ORIENTATION=-